MLASQIESLDSRGSFLARENDFASYQPPHQARKLPPLPGQVSLFDVRTLLTPKSTGSAPGSSIPSAKIAVSSTLAGHYVPASTQQSGSCERLDNFNSTPSHSRKNSPCTSYIIRRESSCSNLMVESSLASAGQTSSVSADSLPSLPSGPTAPQEPSDTNIPDMSTSAKVETQPQHVMFFKAALDDVSGSKAKKVSRSKNALASQKFRQRRKEREREEMAKISLLEGQRDFYRQERNHYRDLSIELQKQLSQWPLSLPNRTSLTGNSN